MPVPHSARRHRSIGCAAALPRAAACERQADRRGERGESTAQIVIIVPVLMLLMLVGVQTALWYHAANVAQVAASRGAGEGSAFGAGQEAALDEARHVAAENHLDLRAVSADVADETIVVTVTVAIPHIVPFFPDVVARTQREPIERFVNEADR